MNEKQQNDLIAYYKLNPEGVKQYGIIKKQQMLTTLKWSFLGTASGYLLSFMIEIALRRSSSERKDIIKAFGLFTCVIGFTFIGYKVSFHEFQKLQLELCKTHGVEVNSENKENTNL